ncbi:MAG: lysine--tRNA ligase [Puniceicoccales bacterium]|jgi:lysyl-tRNA synthetase class 2|nr:lysine--tRNA ligase [Puniceicoccales bacterium]
MDSERVLGANGPVEVTSDVHAVRLKKLAALRARGIDPYRQSCVQSHTTEEARRLLGDKDELNERVSIAGRITAFRLMGKAAFVVLLDRAGSLQCYLSRDGVGTEDYALFKEYDVGDIVAVGGTLFRTSTGEATVRADSITLVSKSLRPLPDKFHGIADSEQIYRERHLDLIANRESRRRAFQRIEILKEIRKFLWSRDFVEVETPFLQNVAGGAAARPFVTHMNALDRDFFLRISLELYLKRMLVAGFDRVFEMGRVFRNEGLSRRHSPEFTMIELYQAYGDHRTMMALVYDLLQHLCETVLGTKEIRQANGEVLRLGGTWREVTYCDLVREATGREDWFKLPREEKLRLCEKFAIEVNSQLEDFAIDNNVFEKMVECKLIQPTFVTQLPRELCPLAKLNRENPKYLDVFELCINGQEVAPAYSEQNDPILQRELFERQVGDDIQALDKDFLTALEYGMPPAGGMGIGIDRLIVLLTGAASIRDTILYPTLRPQSQF